MPTPLTDLVLNMQKRSSLASKLASLLLALLLTTWTMAGCASIPKTAEGITFTDALGREVTVPESPRRVAALIGSFADIWQLSGGSLCAAAEDAWEDFGLELPDAVNIGGAHSPSIELLLSAEPDLVLASASTAANVQMKDTLESAGIAVAYFDVDCFADYLHMLDICTDITGRKDLYQANGLALQSRIEAVKEAVSIPEEQRSVLLLRAASGFVKAKGSSGTILGEMLCDLGCSNIADSDESLLENLSIESILRQEPYRIFVVTMGDDPQAAMDNLTKMMEENPAWGTLAAVREGRLHIMDRQLFNLKPNARWAEAYEFLRTLLTQAP